MERSCFLDRSFFVKADMSFIQIKVLPISETYWRALFSLFSTLDTAHSFWSVVPPFVKKISALIKALSPVNPIRPLHRISLDPCLQRRRSISCQSNYWRLAISCPPKWYSTDSQHLIRNGSSQENAPASPPYLFAHGYTLVSTSFC